MDKFTDKNGKVVLTIDDDGKEKKDEKYFKDKKKKVSAKDYTDEELLEEFNKRKAEGTITDGDVARLNANAIKRLVKKTKDDTTKS